MKRKLSILLIILIFASLLVSCSKNVKFDDVEYKEKGLSFTLPNTMKRQNTDGYDFYFSGMSMDVIFSALKITDEILESTGFDTRMSAEEYVDAIIERRGLEKSKLYYKHYEDLGQFNFRYTYVSESGYETFYFVTVTGTRDNLWYIEMCCDSEESTKYLDTFEVWRRTVRTYQ